MQLGLGGLTTEEITHNCARSEFLRTLERLVPQSVEGLRPAHGAYYDLFRWAISDPQMGRLLHERLARIANQRVSPTFILVEIRSMLGVTTWASVNAAGAHVDELRSLLENWSRAFHLEDEWCMDVALATLYTWTWHCFRALHLLQGVKPLQPGGPVASLLLDHFTVPPVGWAVSGDFRRDGTLTITVQDWEDPARETPENAKKRILDEIDEIVTRHVDIKKDVLGRSAQDWVPAVEKRNPKHFEWLVRYQCDKQSFNQIALKEGCARQSVRDSVRELAEFVSLSLRESTRGRPPGVKEKGPRRRAG